jgi:hypothetical protein
VTGKMNRGRAIGIATAVLTFGIAGPAAARPFDVDSAGSLVPVNIQQTPAVAAPAAPGANGGGSGLEYALIGTGGAAVLLVGVGGTLAASRRRQADAARRSTLVT